MNSPDREGEPDRKNRKRNRVPLSCTICRKRKVKCDKGKPFCSQCSKTGVSHLCHYLEQSWASEAEQELTAIQRETEVEKLRAKIHALEEKLNYGSPAFSESVTSTLSTVPHDFEDDELDLTLKFDMLNVKTGSMSHLGVTSWLAVMKGDPYLKVLWSHIFKVRRTQEGTPADTPVGTPGGSRRASGTGAPSAGGCPVGRQDVGGCPVSGRSGSLSGVGVPSAGGCPVGATITTPSAAAAAGSVAAGSVAAGSVAAPRCPFSGSSMGSTAGIQLPAPTAVSPPHILDAALMPPPRCPVLPPKCPVTSSTSGISMGMSMGAGDVPVSTPAATPASGPPREFSITPSLASLISQLPPRSAINAHLDNFFAHLYPLFPYVDESTFRCSVAQILGSDESITAFKFRNSLDVFLVGTLLVIVRLSYLSNPDTLPEVRPELVTGYAAMVMPKIQQQKRCHLDIIQYMLYQRLYQLYSPEQVDGPGEESQLDSGVLFSMANNLGLFRDPHAFSMSQRQRHVWRKIWYCLCDLDVSRSLNCGSPLALVRVSEYGFGFDTKLPAESRVDWVNELNELAVNRNVAVTWRCNRTVAKVLSVILQVNRKVKKSELDHLIRELETLILDEASELPALSKVTSGDGDASKAVYFKSHVTIRILLYLLNYILFTHYEPRGASDSRATVLAREYAQNALNYALDGYRNCMWFFENGKFGPGAEIVLAPLLLNAAQRSIQFMVSLILRSRCGPLMKPEPAAPGSAPLKSENPHDLPVEIKEPAADISVDSGEQLADILLNHMVEFNKLTAKLSPKYYYCWKMTRATKFFIMLLKKQNIKSFVDTRNVAKVESDRGEVSQILRSVPLVLSAGEEQLKRCPVFFQQDEADQLVSYQPITAARTSNIRNILNPPEHVSPAPATPAPVTPFQPVELEGFMAEQVNNDLFESSFGNTDFFDSLFGMNDGFDKDFISESMFL